MNRQLWLSLVLSVQYISDLLRGASVWWRVALLRAVFTLTIKYQSTGLSFIIMLSNGYHYSFVSLQNIIDHFIILNSDVNPARIQLFDLFFTIIFLNILPKLSLPPHQYTIQQTAFQLFNLMTLNVTNVYHFIYQYFRSLKWLNI